jgi:hypothetical protein
MASWERAVMVVPFSLLVVRCRCWREKAKSHDRSLAKSYEKGNENVINLLLAKPHGKYDENFGHELF